MKEHDREKVIARLVLDAAEHGPAMAVIVDQERRAAVHQEIMTCYHGENIATLRLI